MANLAVTSGKVIINAARQVNKHTEHFMHGLSSGCTTIPSCGIATGSAVPETSSSITKYRNYIKKQWKRFKNYINKISFSKNLTKESCNVTRLSDDSMNEVLKNTIGEKPYRIATSGYSFDTEGYEKPTKAFLKSIDDTLGSKNTGYVLPPTLDKGSIYDITAQISGISKDKSLFVTSETFFDKYLNLKNFPDYINLKDFIRVPIHVFPTPDIYTRATANASNVLVCTGGRKIAVNEIVEAIKRKNKVILLLNLNLKNGTYNSKVNLIENAARYFDELRLSSLSKYTQEEQRELEAILKDKSKINQLVRIYLVNDEKSAAEAGKRAAEFIKSEDFSIISEQKFPNLAEVKKMSLAQLRQLGKTPDGIAIMKKAGILAKRTVRKGTKTVYGQAEHRQIKTADGEVISSSMLISQPDGKTKNILKEIPLEVLQTPVSEHIHKINWTTINPEVGVTVIQNQSKPVIARKIAIEGTLENSLVENNFHNIPLRYDIVKGTQYIETPLNAKRQALTGDGFMVIYSSPAKNVNKAKLISEDRSFMQADIADKQYEILTENGRIPCKFEEMIAGIDYRISKKAGIKLKMAVPPTEVISSEGEILPAGKLYMVDSNGHFYNGNPVTRIKNGEINWNPDMNDPIQRRIKDYIDEIIKFETAEKNTSSHKLQSKLHDQIKRLTSKAEQEMTDWVISAQNKNNANFFI